MARDPSQIPIGINGDVSIAPVGSTLPTDASTALDAAFKPAGFISDAGVTVTQNVETLEVPAWQSPQAARTIVSGLERDLSYELLEWTAETLVHAHGNAGVFTDNADGSADFVPAAIDQQLEVAMVIDALDGANKYRIVIERAVVVDTGDIVFSREGAAMLPVTSRQLAGSPGVNGYQIFIVQSALIP